MNPFWGIAGPTLRTADAWSCRRSLSDAPLLGARPLRLPCESFVPRSAWLPPSSAVCRARCFALVYNCARSCVFVRRRGRPDQGGADGTVGDRTEYSALLAIHGPSTRDPRRRAARAAMSKSSWYNVDTSNIYFASPKVAPPPEPAADAWQPWMAESTFVDTMPDDAFTDSPTAAQLAAVDDGLPRWAKEDGETDVLETIGQNFDLRVPSRPETPPEITEDGVPIYHNAERLEREARARGWIGARKKVEEVSDVADATAKVREEAKNARERLKASVRASIAAEDAKTADREAGVLAKDRENALKVAAVVEMLRADDEALEETQ